YLPPPGSPGAPARRTDQRPLSGRSRRAYASSYPRTRYPEPFRTGRRRARYSRRRKCAAQARATQGAPGCLSPSYRRYHCTMPEPTRLPARDECVVRELLLRRAAEGPERDFVLFESGERWTYAEAPRRARRAAAG